MLNSSSPTMTAVGCGKSSVKSSSTIDIVVTSSHVGLLETILTLYGIIDT